MNDDRRKMLTEFLCEYWHEIYWHDLRGSACNKCDAPLNGIFDLQRTFSTAQDMVDLAKRLVEVWRWNGFYGYTYEKNTSGCWGWDMDEIEHWAEFDAWIITDPARFCELVAEFLEVKT